MSRSGEETSIIRPALHLYRLCKLQEDLAPKTQKNSGLCNILASGLACYMLVFMHSSVLRKLNRANLFLLFTCLLKCFAVLKTCHHEHSSQFKSSSIRWEVWSLVILVPRVQRRRRIKSVMSEKGTYFVYSQLISPENWCIVVFVTLPCFHQDELRRDIRGSNVTTYNFSVCRVLGHSCPPALCFNTILHPLLECDWLFFLVMSVIVHVTFELLTVRNLRLWELEPSTNLVIMFLFILFCFERYVL